MAYDISYAALAHISNFAVGLVVRKEGAGGDVLGSGVLASIEGRRGILTSGHVADRYEKLAEIGLIRFVAGSQRLLLRLGDTQTLILQCSDTFKEVLDLAFTQLLPDVASSIGAEAIFLNIEKNRARMETGEPAEAKHIDVMQGFVAEFSEKPFVAGKEFISPMQGVLHTGHLCTQENGLLTMEAMSYNLDKFPEKLCRNERRRAMAHLLR